MSTEILKNSSNIVSENKINSKNKVNISAIRHRIFLEKKKEKFNRLIVTSTIVLSLGLISYLVT